MLVRSSEADTKHIAPKTDWQVVRFTQTRCRLASDGLLGDTALGTHIASRFPNGRLKARNGSFCDPRRDETMVRLSTRQRTVLVDKLPDIPNVAAGALVFGQFLGDQEYSLALALYGVGTWSALMGFTLLLAKGSGR